MLSFSEVAGVLHGLRQQEERQSSGQTYLAYGDFVAPKQSGVAVCICVCRVCVAKP